MTDPLTELTDKIRQFVIQRFPLAQQGALDAEQDLLQTGVIDSLGILELVNFLAEEFSVVVEDDELLPENFSSIRRLAVFVERKQ
jgi:acyl carrier protein